MIPNVELLKQCIKDAELEEQYGPNAVPLFGLALYLEADNYEALASDSLTDMYDDKKIDFCYVDRTLKFAVVAQGYCSKTWGKNSADANKAADLNTALSWIVSGDIDDIPSEIRDFIRDLRAAINNREIDRIEFLYLHNCIESKNIQKELDTLAKQASKLLKDNDIIALSKELGLNAICDMIRRSDAEIFVPVGLKLADEDVLFEKGPSWKACVTSMSGKWLRSLHAKHGDSLFQANYRDFLGIRNSARNINNGIRKTVQEDPENFWTYNNGITALCKRLRKSGNNYLVSGLSIINGAQTTGSISQSDGKVDEVNVLCRFVQCDDDAILDNIIKYNNTQNAFRASDQRSNDIVQKKLKEELAAYGYNYTPRRAAFRKKKTDLSAESIGVALCALHGSPQIALRNRDQIFENDVYYNKLFSSYCSAEHVLLVYYFSSAIDDVKLTLKRLVGEAKASKTQKKMYDVLRHSASKLFVLAILGGVADEIIGENPSSLFSWRLQKGKIKLSKEKMIFPFREVVEVVLPIISKAIVAPDSMEDEDYYNATRDLSNMKKYIDSVATFINMAGELASNRFQQLRDITSPQTSEVLMFVRSGRHKKSGRTSDAALGRKAWEESGWRSSSASPFLVG